MQEAKFSLNVRFNFKGYDSQFTMRDDENGAPLLDKFAQVITRLEKMGALPERRWEGVKNGNGNGNGHAVAAAAATATPAPKVEPKAELPKGWKGETRPLCRSCGSDFDMELVEFVKDGKDRKEWKCQACKKWHYDKKGK